MSELERVQRLLKADPPPIGTAPRRAEPEAAQGRPGPPPELRVPPVALRPPAGLPMPEPPRLPLWVDLLGALTLPLGAGGLTALAAQRLPWLLRWLAPAAARVAATGGWDVVAGRDPTEGMAAQAVLEAVGTPVAAAVPRLGPLGARAARREAIRTTERALGEVGQELGRARQALGATRDAERRAAEAAIEAFVRDVQEAVPWWRRFGSGRSAFEQIVESTAGREVLTEEFGRALKNAARDLEGTMLQVTQPELQLLRAKPEGLMSGTGLYLVDAGQTLRTIYQLPQAARARAVRVLDEVLDRQALPDTPALRELQDARAIFRQGVRLLDYLWSGQRLPLTGGLAQLRALAERPPKRLVGAEEAAEAVRGLRQRLAEAAERLAEGPSAAEQERLIRRLEQQARRLEETLAHLRRGELPERMGRGVTGYAHIPGVPVGLHMGRFLWTGIPRTPAEYLWIQTAPSVLGAGVGAMRADVPRPEGGGGWPVPGR